MEKKQTHEEEKTNERKKMEGKPQRGKTKRMERQDEK
jgi:hypothetical protein